MCLPAASVLPIRKSENFGTFSFYEQLSVKPNDLPMSQRTGFDHHAPALGSGNPASDLGIGFLLQFLTAGPGPSPTYIDVRASVVIGGTADVANLCVHVLGADGAWRSEACVDSPVGPCDFFCRRPVIDTRLVAAITASKAGTRCDRTLATSAIANVAADNDHRPMGGSTCLSPAA